MTKKQERFEKKTQAGERAVLTTLPHLKAKILDERAIRLSEYTQGGSTMKKTQEVKVAPKVEAKATTKVEQKVAPKVAPKVVATPKPPYHTKVGKVVDKTYVFDKREFTSLTDVLEHVEKALTHNDGSIRELIICVAKPKEVK